jgi:hypothetical protein
LRPNPSFHKESGAAMRAFNAASREGRWDYGVNRKQALTTGKQNMLALKGKIVTGVAGVFGCVPEVKIAIVSVGHE